MPALQVREAYRMGPIAKGLWKAGSLPAFQGPFAVDAKAGHVTLFGRPAGMVSCKKKGYR